MGLFLDRCYGTIQVLKQSRSPRDGFSLTPQAVPVHTVDASQTTTSTSTLSKKKKVSYNFYIHFIFWVICCALKLVIRSQEFSKIDYIDDSTGSTKESARSRVLTPSPSTAHGQTFGEDIPIARCHLSSLAKCRIIPGPVPASTVLTPASSVLLPPLGARVRHAPWVHARS